MSYTFNDVFTASTEYFYGETLPAHAFTDKYALANNEEYFELTPSDSQDRWANELYRIENQYTNPLQYSTIRASLDHFDKVCLQGSPMYGVGNPYAIISLSNCTVIDYPKDNLSDIYNKAREMANLFKRRCGVGVSIDKLRPAGARVKNSAKTSTGAWSFADLYSYVCHHTGQRGRRGALMITISVKHPDIDRFILMKEDRTKVTGANVSIMLDDEFMNAVLDDDEWITTFPLENVDIDDVYAQGGEWVEHPVDSIPAYWSYRPDVYMVEQLKGNPIAFKEWIPNNIEEKRILKSFKARDLWYLICKNAHSSAEPGLIFIDNYKKNLPLDFYKGFESVTVNPCSEILLSKNDSCRLITMNLLGFVVNPYTENAYFDWDSFIKHTHYIMRFADDLLDLELECLAKIIDAADTDDEKELFRQMYFAAEQGRRTGVGTHGLASMLMALSLKYDDPDVTRQFIDDVYRTYRDELFRESIRLAKERGAFPAFDWEIDKKSDFIQRLPEDIKADLAKYGRRNGAILTNAPTGTTSMVSLTTSGVEPEFAFIYFRSKKIMGDVDENVRVDRIDANGDKWQEYAVVSSDIKRWLKANNKELPDFADAPAWKKIVENLPDYFVNSASINWDERVRLQGTIQQYIDHGISSTINLPRDTTVEQVQQIYEESWKAGLKGVTVYREGSRDAVLSTSSQIANSSKDEWYKRPRLLEADVHHVSAKANGYINKFIIIVGLRDGEPYEIFGGLDNGNIPKNITEGTISKRKDGKKNRYEFSGLLDLENTKNTFVIDSLGTEFHSGQFSAFNRMMSLSLRNKSGVNHVVEQLTKDTESDFYAYEKVMSRVLKKYIKENTVSSAACPKCEERTVVFKEGCFQCTSCGHTKCG